MLVCRQPMLSFTTTAYYYKKTTTKQLSLNARLDKNARLAAVKLKASHRTLLFKLIKHSAERRNYYLLWSWCFHSLLCVLIPGQILSVVVPTLSE